MTVAVKTKDLADHINKLICDRIVQITCLSIHDEEEEVTVWSHTFEDAVRQAYFALHMKLDKEGA